MTYISLLSDFAVVISSVRGFILTSVRLFLQMLNGREYEDQSHFKSRSCTIVSLYNKTVMVAGLLQVGHKLTSLHAQSRLIL